ncbi:MAG: class I SAM-dependent methyltransferase [Proteobacteria bacterium]|nr:MAG: class I SAM-dependent methyltransferase [Pseudomonadota bacterium]
MTKTSGIDKYEYYAKSVQSPDVDALFLQKTYSSLKGKEPKTLREDFCAAFALCCEWTRLGSDKLSIGIDLDEEPLDYGRKHYLSTLSPEEQKRVNVLSQNVLSPEMPHADIIAALNFSYMGFKTRPLLKQYIENCHKTLNDGGLLIFDCFGGPASQEPNESESEYDDFSYFWDQDTFDPLTNEGMFYIHYQPKGQKKIEKVFTYDWRMWGIPELKDLMEEAGFKKIHFYWEGTDEDGEGDGNYSKVTKGEICDSWVAYIVGEK